MHSKRRGRPRKAAGRQSPDEEQVSNTPSKRVRLNVAQGEEAVVQASTVVVSAGRVVTPSTAASTARTQSAIAAYASPARRSLFTPSVATATVTPSRAETSTTKRRLLFGRMVAELPIQQNVRQVYKIVKRLTGSLGGNASSGPIYGELTMHSMQKMINLMKEHTGFSAESRFIDVGSGIGKPNLHVTQDPGVCFSYGIEVEEARWVLGMTCLNGVLGEAASQASNRLTVDERILHRCVFEKGDIRQAKIFDPFTHVYMFSIGYVKLA